MIIRMVFTASSASLFLLPCSTHASENLPKRSSSVRTGSLPFRLFCVICRLSLRLVEHAKLFVGYFGRMTHSVDLQSVQIENVNGEIV